MSGSTGREGVAMSRGRVAVFAVLALVVGFGLALAAVALGWLDWSGITPGAWGSFPRPPVVQLLDDGRRLQLLEDFAYIDPRGRLWSAPKDSVVDGASIPQVFWSITGGPLEGKYRNASIVHDVACDRRTVPWEQVHMMFYEACRCGGVPENQAKLLYAAVYHFGPRWEVKDVNAPVVVQTPDGKMRPLKIERKATEVVKQREPTEADRKALEQYVQEKTRSLEELRQWPGKDR
jgi:hypothetical protein